MSRRRKRKTSRGRKISAALKRYWAKRRRKRPKRKSWKGKWRTITGAGYGSEKEFDAAKFLRENPAVIEQDSHGGIKIIWN